MRQDHKGVYVYPMADNDIPSDQPGITRRDWLAGLAMQGLLSSAKPSDGDLPAGAFALAAYDFADAMIKKGKKEG